MDIQQVQVNLFKIYLNRGYRLAYRLDPVGFCAGLGLGPEERDYLTRLTIDDLEPFAAELAAKRVAQLRTAMPRTFRWIEGNLPELPAEYCDVQPTTVADGIHHSVERFPGYLREYRDFYGTVPQAVVDTAEFEAALQGCRRAWREQLDDEPEACFETFSWNSVYWSPLRTRGLSLATDVMRPESAPVSGDSVNSPTSLVVSWVAGRPKTLRVSPSVLALVVALAQPRRADRLRDTYMSEAQTQAALVQLSRSGVIHCLVGPTKEQTVD